MQHCRKSRRFCVRVPVLSVSRYPTWPSSSLSEVLLASAGLSASCQYISKSQPINRLWTVWITSNLQNHITHTTHTHTDVLSRIQHCLIKRRVGDLRDVESYRHGGAEEDDIAPEHEEPCVDGVAINHHR